MPLIHVIILLATGLAIGFISGLLGIGGGIIMTPVQYWLYTSNGLGTDLAIKISFATTLAAIFPTAVSGVWQHQKTGRIYWKAAIFMGIFTASGSFIGAMLAAHIPGSTLKIAFGIVTLAVAIRMLVVKISDTERPIRENRWLWFGLAFPLGIITGVLGLGGGIFVVPVLVLVLRFRIHNAMATSLAMLLFTSAGGIAGFVLSGSQAANLPPFTIGYILWPAWVVLSIGSIAMAQVGARVAPRVPGQYLNYAFVALLFYISLDMLGAVSWIVHYFS
jgi:uncharacterized membrane protein YfcA